MTVSTSSSLPSAKRTFRPSASTARCFNSTPRRLRPRGLEPMSVSRCCSRRPIRDSTVVLRSREVGATRRDHARAGVAAAASAASRRRGRPCGSPRALRRSGSPCSRRRRRAPCRRGRRLAADTPCCAPGTRPAPSRLAISGTCGVWKGPVATTTCSAVIGLPSTSRTKTSFSELSLRTGLFNSTGGSKVSAYCSR